MYRGPACSARLLFAARRRVVVGAHET